MKRVAYTEKPGMDAINLIMKMHQEKIAELVDWSTVVDNDSKTYLFYNGKTAMDIMWNTSLDLKRLKDWAKREKFSFDIGQELLYDNVSILPTTED